MLCYVGSTRNGAICHEDTGDALDSVYNPVASGRGRVVL